MFQRLLSALVIFYVDCYMTPVGSSFSDHAPSIPNQMSQPCRYPLPYTREFEIFCQLDYHKTPYICDPNGLLSRTEVELLHQMVRNFNMTSCFCGTSCSGRENKLGIVIVPDATIRGLEACDPTGTHISPSSSLASVYRFGLLLSEHWARQCKADVMILYIKLRMPNMLSRPFILPVYANSLERLQRYSRPQALSPRDPLFKVLQNQLRHSRRLIDAELTPVNTSIPSWAKYTAVGLLGIVCFAIYVANCVTNTLGQASQKQKSSIASVRHSSDRFRAGFGGGMMMNNSQQKKSVMLFRTFSKAPRTTTTNRL